MQVTVVRQPGTKHEDGPSTVLEALTLPGDMPTTMTWYYGDDIACNNDTRGEVFRVTLEHLPGAGLVE